eukprot:494705-Prorocentrum_minimum.AAC.1
MPWTLDPSSSEAEMEAGRAVTCRAGFPRAGHRSITHTNRYLHPTPAPLPSACRLLMVRSPQRAHSRKWPSRSSACGRLPGPRRGSKG